MLVVTTPTPEQTRDLGACLGQLLSSGDLVLLHGDLGAGKTTFTQGVARGLGVVTFVQSPTFTLVHEHLGATSQEQPVTLFHLDLYRLAKEEELESFGFADYLTPTGGITIIEWPELARDALPESFLLVQLEATGEASRRITFQAVPPDGKYANHVARLDPANSPIRE